MSCVQSKMYSTGEAADILGISQSTVIKYIKNGWLIPDRELPSSGNRAGKRLFSEETINEFMEKMKSKGE